MKIFKHRASLMPILGCGLRAAALLYFMIFTALPIMQVGAAVTFVAPEWKSHFKTNMVIENCIFQEISFSFATTNLFQIRYQNNAFLMRQIDNVAEAESNHIVGGSLYAGGWESNYWAIEAGHVLKLFPNADKMLAEMHNPEASLIEAPRRKLIGALFYGFHLLDPSTIKWIDESTFTASSFRGDKYRFRGEILDAQDGLPTRIEWHEEGDLNLHFITEYKYLGNLDLSYYPSEIFVQANLKGKWQPVVAYHILALKTSNESMPATWFDPERYFSPPASSFAQVLMVTNDQMFAKNGAVWTEVLTTPPPYDPLIHGELNRDAVRAIIIAFFLLSTCGFYFVWKHSKNK
jgi:hypothetical protein